MLRRILLTAGLTTFACGLSIAPAHAWTSVPAPTPAAAGAVPDCGTSFNPYAYTRKALAACGIRTFPLTSQTALSGGGELYSYAEPHGEVASIAIPPAGLDLATAGAARLQEYGIPGSAPAGVSTAQWTQDLATLKIPTAPDFLVSVATHSGFNGTSTNWSGFADGVNHKGHFDGVTAQYTEPTYDDTVCAAANPSGLPSQAALTFAGIGGLNSTGALTVTKNARLAEAGTAHDVPELADHQTWYEIYPLETIQVLPATAAAGDAISTEINEVAAGTGKVTYSGSIDDTTTNTVQTFSQTVPASDYTGKSVEMVVARPSEPVNTTSYYVPLADFGFVPVSAFSSSTSPGVFTSITSTTKGVDSLRMINEADTDVLALTNGISAGQFTVFDNTCGIDEVAP